MSKKSTPETPQTPTAKKGNLEVNRLSPFQGTRHRKDMMQTVIQILREELANTEPQTESDIVSIISYKTGLTTRKIKEDYIDVLIGVKILQRNRVFLEFGVNGESA